MYCNSLTLAIFRACHLCRAKAANATPEHRTKHPAICLARVKKAVRQQPVGFISNRRGIHSSTFPCQECLIPGSCGTHHTQILRPARPAAPTYEEHPQGREGSPRPARKTVPTGLEYPSGLVLEAPQGILMCSWGG